MSTSYIISVGYNSTAAREDVGAKLHEVIADIRANPDRIVREVLRIEPDIGDAVVDCAEYYRPSGDEDDHTIRIEEEDGPCIHQCASGGGENRNIKEACRRAFARLVIEAMHRERMEVSFNVC